MPKTFHIEGVRKKLWVLQGDIAKGATLENRAVPWKRHNFVDTYFFEANKVSMGIYLKIKC